MCVAGLVMHPRAAIIDPTLLPPDVSPAPSSALCHAQRSIAAVVVGNALEFYDFLTYAFFAVHIGRAFFPARNPSSTNRRSFSSMNRPRAWTRSIASRCGTCSTN